MDENEKGLRAWAEAVVAVAYAEGMSDDVVIPTWPEGCDGPKLTVGMVRAYNFPFKPNPRCRYSSDCRLAGFCMDLWRCSATNEKETNHG